jgi:hypothetical protein
MLIFGFYCFAEMVSTQNPTTQWQLIPDAKVS